MTATSWVESANAPECSFPLQNLPYGAFRRPGEAARCGVAIGSFVLDLAVLEAEGLLQTGAPRPVFSEPTINAFMALGPAVWSRVRERLTALLVRDGSADIRDDAILRGKALLPLDAIELLLPIKVAGYTDFYSARQHAFNVGTMLRGPENALSPNWLHMPIGYNGRASTVVVSGTDIRRPLGQRKPSKSDAPVFVASARLDVELEVGAVVGLPSTMGEPVTVSEADDMIFGYVLLNDWSARDIQAWEYQPLGPFQSKIFATSISPWVVTKAALEPFRVSTPAREKPLLAYLSEPRSMLYDIALEISMRPPGATKATTLSRTNYRHLYYSAAQQLAHLAVGGCKIETGDLLGSGTISGPDKSEFGSLLELSWGGRDPISLDTGETRTFIENGDTLTLTGWAQGDGYRIGFGECAGTILPSPAERKW